jgi:hypothetical protein
MLLETQDAELFFRLHRALMLFVNQRLKVIAKQFATPEEYAVPQGGSGDCVQQDPMLVIGCGRLIGAS